MTSALYADWKTKYTSSLIYEDSSTGWCVERHTCLPVDAIKRNLYEVADCNYRTPYGIQIEVLKVDKHAGTTNTNKVASWNLTDITNFSVVMHMLVCLASCPELVSCEFLELDFYADPMPSSGKERKLLYSLAFSGNAEAKKNESLSQAIYKTLLSEGILRPNW